METTQKIKWARGTLGQQPAGYNDIYWCEAKNGPTIPVRNEEVRCQLCGHRLVDDPNRHDFVVHSELELASTIVYMDREASEVSQRRSIDDVTERVNDIKPHFSRAQVRRWVEKLLDEGVLNSTVEIAERA